MLFPIEIKANIDGQVPDALEVLAPLLPRPDPARNIYFAEDATAVDTGEQPLSSAGVIVRIRVGGNKDDATAKLRPCAETQLGGDWTAPFKEPPLEYRIEGDWSRHHHVLSASAVVTYEGGELLGAVAPGGDARDALSNRQRTFLRRCAPPGVDVGHLRALGPITSTAWSKVPLPGQKVSVERWSVLDLDFLEFSIRLKPKPGEHDAEYAARAEHEQAQVHAAITDLGLTLSTNDDNKTQRVLTALLAAVRR